MKKFLTIAFLIGLGYLFVKYPLNTSGDPFGAPPKGIYENCGPERRYKFDAAINSKDDFVNFIKNNQTSLSTWIILRTVQRETLTGIKCWPLSTPKQAGVGLFISSTTNRPHVQDIYSK